MRRSATEGAGLVEEPDSTVRPQPALAHNNIAATTAPTEGNLAARGAAPTGVRADPRGRDLPATLRTFSELIVTRNPMASPITV
ncbi:hypothetical protein [Mycobacteroides salmoniphilum]|uniref:hypothetical protein n=1 Tax=Mycobacteroides salmoniphilum TaxID=404941 RepID=UPI001292C578|nr:hypothetical protein [Mycobacteroides salmoniphilum]